MNILPLYPSFVTFPFPACDAIAPSAGVVNTIISKFLIRSMLPPSPTCPCSHRFHTPVSRILNKISYDPAVAVAYII